MRWVFAYVSKPPFSGMNLDGNQLRHAKERPVKVVVREDGWNFVKLLGFHWETSPTDLTCNLFRGYLGGWASLEDVSRMASLKGLPRLVFWILGGGKW